MPKGFVVNEPFTRNGEAFHKGKIISDRDEVAALEGSDQEHHLIATTVPEPVETQAPAKRGSKER